MLEACFLSRLQQFQMVVTNKALDESRKTKQKNNKENLYCIIKLSALVKCNEIKVVEFP